MPAAEANELPVTFSAFIVSLAQSALMHLGDTPDPDTGRSAPHLGLARNTIDLLGLMQEKTKGNLDEEEQKLLESLLYDLRTRFVARSNKS